MTPCLAGSTHQHRGRCRWTIRGDFRCRSTEPVDDRRDDRTTDVRRFPPATRPPSVGPAGANPGAVLAAIAGGGIAVVALWWHDTASISGVGDWLTNAGRITGLLAGYAMVVLVALMARIPPLERGIGADRLARWHAMGGRYTVSLDRRPRPADHLGLRGHGAHRRRQPDRDAADQLPRRADGDRRRPAVRRRRDRLGPRRAPADALRDLVLPALLHLPRHRAGVQPPVRHRRRLHDQPAGPGGVVGDVPRRAAPPFSGTASWCPLVQASRHQMRVAAVHPEAPGVVVDRRHRARPRPSCGRQAGQFFRWRFLTRDLWWASNPYSLSAAPRPNSLRITVKDLGEHSAALIAAAPGHPRRRRRTVRRDDRGPPHPPQGAAHRRRHRHHAAAGAVRVAARRAGRHHADLPRAPRGRRRVPRRAGRDRRGSAAPGCSSSPAAGADLGWDPLSRRRARRGGARHPRSTTSTSAAPTR